MPLPTWFWDGDDFELPPPPVVPEVVEEPDPAILASMLNTAGGRARIVASMTQSFWALRDNAAVGRKLFSVEQIPEAANAIFEGRDHPTSEQE